MSRKRTRRLNSFQPNHPVLNFPNKIGPPILKAGWRSADYGFSPHGTTAMFPSLRRMTGSEAPGGRVIGRPIRKRLVGLQRLFLYRQISFAVPGAVRLFANMLAMELTTPRGVQMWARNNGSRTAEGAHANSPECVSRSTWLHLCAGEQDLTGALNSIAAYRATQQVEGTIRTWGDTRCNVLWRNGTWLQSSSTGIRFETNLRGAASALGGLYTGEADVALIESDPWPVDIDGFRRGAAIQTARTRDFLGRADDRAINLCSQCLSTGRTLCPL